MTRLPPLCRVQQDVITRAILTEKAPSRHVSADFFQLAVAQRYSYNAYIMSDYNLLYRIPQARQGVYTPVT